MSQHGTYIEAPAVIFNILQLYTGYMYRCTTYHGSVRRGLQRGAQ